MELIWRLRDVDYDGVFSVAYIGADRPEDEIGRMVTDAHAALDFLV